MPKLFLVVGKEYPMGSLGGRTVYRHFKAENTMKAIEIATTRSHDDYGEAMFHLEEKKLFEEVDLPK